MNLTIPKSIVHAKAEILSQIEFVREIETRRKQRRSYDVRELKLAQGRIFFLRKWIKNQISGDSKCHGCQVLSMIYSECKGILPEKIRKQIWDMLHNSGSLTGNITKKDDKRPDHDSQ